MQFSHLENDTPVGKDPAQTVAASEILILSHVALVFHADATPAAEQNALSLTIILKIPLWVNPVKAALKRANASCQKPVVSVMKCVPISNILFYLEEAVFFAS